MLCIHLLEAIEVLLYIGCSVTVPELCEVSSAALSWHAGPQSSPAASSVFPNSPETRREERVSQ